MNYACSLITRKLSNKPKLHDLALAIHKLSSAHKIDLNQAGYQGRKK